MDGSRGADLKEAARLVGPHIDAVLEAFYERALADADRAGFFTSPDRITFAREAQKKHWLRLLSGVFDKEYFESVQRIGLTHARIQLPINVYMSAYALAASDILDCLIGKSSGWFGARGRTRHMATAVMRAFTMDMAQVIEIYAAKVQDEQDRAFTFLDAAIETMARGDLTHRIPDPSPDGFPESYNPIRERLNATVTRLSGILSAIGARAAELTRSTNEVGGNIDELSRRTESQAASLEETAAAMQELSTSVSGSTEATDSASRVASAARRELEDGIGLIRDTGEAMARIQAASDRISQIIGVIDDVSFQTNLLALNAGVEAARAGDAGRGFAVVANEVRTLASSTAEAAGEIKQLINASADEVASGVKLTENVGDAFGKIMERFNKVSELTTMVAAAAQEQSRAVGEVNTSVSQIDQITQHNAAMVEETTAATQIMRSCAGEMQTMLGNLRLVKDAPEQGLYQSQTQQHRGRGRAA
ncbi:methyl-accepting chemotaxis protein [Tropicibacter sp. S64]|uniref:methyl-accepting chemotaxis protein n=1 Tax=Tropicibacter sp. S64 TaxID=3415122 RepID=UPI003C7A8F21